jgi:hypothetical protein
VFLDGFNVVTGRSIRPDSPPLPINENFVKEVWRTVIARRVVPRCKQTSKIGEIGESFRSASPPAKRPLSGIAPTGHL